MIDGARTRGESRPWSAPKGRRGDQPSIQSVDRALNLLEAMVDAGGEASLTDLSARTHLNISTCHHLLATLVKRGYVAKVHGKRTYALGSRVLHLRNAWLRQVDLPRRAESFMVRISETTGEMVQLAMLQGSRVVTVLSREARHAVRVDAGSIGLADAPHMSTIGRAMLAWLPDNEMRRLLEASAESATSSCAVDSETLSEELRHVRRNGYAQDEEQFRPGVVCVAAAIRDHAGAVVGALSASAPTMRGSDTHMAAMRQAVVAAARDLSDELGAPGQSFQGLAQTGTAAPAVAIAVKTKQRGD